MSEPKQLVIDRTKWGRNEHNISDFSGELLTSDGKMCCLGFYALQCAGATEADIYQRGTLYNTSKLSWGDGLMARMPTGFTGQTDVCDNLMGYNDNIDVSDREGRITDEFAKINVAVTFVN